MLVMVNSHEITENLVQKPILKIKSGIEKKVCTRGGSPLGIKLFIYWTRFSVRY